MRLLFISNLFPDTAEPYRGLDNVTVLHALREHHGWNIRVIAPRPWLPGIQRRPACQPRPQDTLFEPLYLPVPYLPKIGGVANHRLMAAALRCPLHALRSAFPWDSLLTSWLFPDACAASQAIAPWPFTHRVLLAQGSDVHAYLRSPLRRRAILRALAEAPACITRSRSLATQLAAAGADPTRLHPIVNGIDTSIFNAHGPLPEAPPPSLPAQAPVLLFVGNLLPVKDPSFLLNAFAQLPACPSHEPPHLVLAGKGPLRQELDAQAARLGIAHRVHFLGPQTAPQVASWMRRASLLAMTSRNEGLPNVILEAQACGLPVVATSVGGIAEVIDAPWKGRLTPPADLTAWITAAAEMLAAPTDRTRIATLGATRTWQAAANAYHALLTPSPPASQSP